MRIGYLLILPASLCGVFACGSDKAPGFKSADIEQSGGSPTGIEGSGGTSSASADDAGVGSAGTGEGSVDAGGQAPVTTKYDAGLPPPEPGDLSVSGCDTDRAFAMVSGAFVQPTPPSLALVLNASAYDNEPFSVVVRYAEAGSTAAASYTVDASGSRTFPAGLVPDFATVLARVGGFDSSAVQAAGWLLIETGDGPQALPLEDLGVSVSVRDFCTRATVILSGSVSADDADLVAELSGEPIEVDAGGPRAGPSSTPVRGIFEGELVNFDFGSLQ